MIETGTDGTQEGADVTQAPSASPRQVLVGAYRIERVLAAGAAATVSLGRDAGGAPTAIKMLNEGASALGRRRFLDVAATTWDQAGPSVVRVLDVAEHDGRPYVVLEYADGASLEDWMRARASGALTLAEVLAIARGIAACLVDLHGRGVAHRNLKPSNVLRRKDREPHVVLADLRSASSSADPAVDAPDSPYRAPELGRDGLGNRSSDIYAAGAIAHAALLGLAAVPRPGIAPARPSRLRPEIPEMLDVALLAAMSPDREARPTARQWCAMLGVAARDVASPDVASRDVLAQDVAAAPARTPAMAPPTESDAPAMAPPTETPARVQGAAGSRGGSTGGRGDGTPPIATAYRTTHRVVAALSYRKQPDPVAQPDGLLPPGLEVAVAEWRGAWARVVAPNGWSAWVDGRLLQALGASGG
jgi:hypothetical protein